MKQNYEKDKARLLGWMEKYCHGYKNARKRPDILPFVFLGDRYFRTLISNLKHENHIASTSTRGYWFIPLHTTNQAEVNAVLESIQEMKSRAMDMLKGSSKLEQHWQHEKARITQGQGELAFNG